MRMRVKVEGIDVAMDIIKEQIREVRDAFVIVGFYNLVEATPVDSGTARASWDIAPNAASIKKIPYDEYPYPSIPDVPQREYVVLGSKNKYLQFLNEGWSDQAPSMFVEKAVNAAIEEVTAL